MNRIRLLVRGRSCRAWVLSLGRLWLVGSVLALVGCGDDDARVDAGDPPDASFDASLDASFDASFDATFDAGAADSGADGGVPVDVGPDAERPEVASLDEVADVLCPAVARIRCTTPQACSCPRVDIFDLDECLEYERSDCRVALENRARGEGIAAGRIATDLAALGSCTAALESSYMRCTGSIVDLEARCLSSFVDLDADLGDGCAEALCAGGAGVCSREDGRCRERPGRGELCDLVCAEGLVCSSGRCREPGDVGASCASDAECAGDLACAGGRCRRLVPLDGACSESDECALGLRCDDGACRSADAVVCEDDVVCAGLERCGPETYEGWCRERAPLGALCEASDACLEARCDFETGQCARRSTVDEPCGGVADCVEGLTCAFSATCQVPGEVGQRCVESFDGLGCAAGLGCFEGICGPLGRDGDLCDDVGRCAQPFLCRADAGALRCGLPREIGEPCESSDECGDARCDFLETGACAPPLPAGAPCFSDKDCGGSLVCFFDDVTFAQRCAPAPRLGERCGSSACPPDAYCRSEPQPRRCEPRVCDELFVFPIEGF